MSLRFIGAVVAILTLSVACISAPAEAATRSTSRSSWSSSRNSELPAEETERASSRRGVSSAAQKAINALDKDPVEKLPIPILLGVARSDLTPNFGDPRDGGTRTHQGLDIMATKDSFIVSPTDAVVLRISTGSSAGNYVYTANPGGETFVYMHLNAFADGLKEGAVLKPGDLIGYVGNTGNAAGGPTHLHFEIREGRTPTDPYPRLIGAFTPEERLAALTKIAKELPNGAELLKKASAATTAGYTRDLTLKSEGTDVALLQAFLIARDTGPKASALAAAGATGYFGAITKAALAEYQASVGITPAAGYFGPVTRAAVAARG